MSFWHKMLTQTVTYWPNRTGPGQILRARWSVVRGRFYTEDQRKAAEKTTVITENPLEKGGLVAPGNFVGVSFSAVPQLHEIDSTKVTPDLQGDSELHRATLLPIWGRTPETVRVYSMRNRVTPRSRVLERDELVYDGPAAVIRAGGPNSVVEAGQRAIQCDAQVVIPVFTGVSGLGQVEIEWDWIGGELLMDGIAVIADSQWSSFWMAFDCTMHRANAPDYVEPEPDP